MERNIRVLFVASGNAQLGISPIVENQGDSLKNCGIHLEYFTIKGKGIEGYLKNISKLKQSLNKDRFDIIHAHYGLCGIISHLARTDEKLIVSYMGDDLLGSNKINGSYTFFSKCLVQINRYFARKSNDYLIVKSKNLASVLNDVVNIAVIPNGVDFNKFYPIDRNIAREKLNLNPIARIVLFVTNRFQRPEKNLTLARNAYQLVEKEQIDLQVVGGVSQEVLNLYYNAADVLLLTSFHEGSPNVIKEAMACNCPIVSTDVGDVREVISGTDGCFLVNFDPQDIAEKIKLALEFNQRTTGRENIYHLEAGKIAQRIISIYQKVLEQN